MANTFIVLLQKIVFNSNPVLGEKYACGYIILS